VLHPWLVEVSRGAEEEIWALPHSDPGTPPADLVYGLLFDTTSHCEGVLRTVAELESGRYDDVDMVLLRLGPFGPGDLMEIKRNIVQLDTVYYNLMGPGLDYLDYSDVEEMHRLLASGLLWGGPRRAPRAEVDIDALAEHLGERGKLSLPSRRVLARALREVARAVANFLRTVDAAGDYLRQPVWVGFWAMHLALLEVRRTIVRLEPLWVLYDRTRYLG
jgi:hypothetical protein